MKISIRVYPIEYFALYHYCKIIAENVKALSPEHRHIYDVVIWDLYELLHKSIWKWQHYKSNDKMYLFTMDYSDAHTLGFHLVHNCPSIELQQILDKLHKAMVDTTGVLIEQLR